MINIAIIDRNEIHRASLRTLLGQIDGFRVVVDSDDFKSINLPELNPPDVVLIDNSDGSDQCTRQINNLMGIMPGVRTIVLVMFREELESDYKNTDAILKSSSKKEFENRIKKLVSQNNSLMKNNL